MAGGGFLDGGILTGLVLFTGWVAWLASRHVSGETPSLKERAGETGEVLVGCGIPVFFTVGQMLTFGLGGFATHLLMERLLAYVNLEAWIEKGLQNSTPFLGGLLTMCGYVFLLLWWQDRGQRKVR